MPGIGRAGPIGRVARLILGLCLAVITLPVYFEADRTYILSVLGLFLGLIGIYTLLHHLFSRHLAHRGRWVGAVLAVLPAFLVWLLGQGGGVLFGEGEGGTAALTYLTVSFLVDSLRAGSGCEVMAIPGLLLRKRTQLPCLLLFPIDRAEAASR